GLSGQQQHLHLDHQPRPGSRLLPLLGLGPRLRQLGRLRQLRRPLGQLQQQHHVHPDVRFLGRHRALTAALAAGLAFASLGEAGTRASPQFAAALPATRLQFGLTNLDPTWMTTSGVPCGYRYTYLAGGVNTTGNWLTWQDPAKPPGQFALDYMNNS